MTKARKRRIIFRLLCQAIATICCAPACIQMYIGMEQEPTHLISTDISSCQESSNQYYLNKNNYSIIGIYYEEDESILFDGLAEKHYYYFDILVHDENNKGCILSVKTTDSILENSDHITFRIDGYISELPKDIRVNRSIKDYPDGVQVLDLCLHEGRLYINRTNRILFYISMLAIILFDISMIRSTHKRYRR